MLREVRYRGTRAEVLFNDMGGDEVAVVVLQWSGEKRIWEWEDIYSPDRLSLERMSLTPPVDLAVPR
jgi:hypothetical protein